ncbi:MAG: LuxR C-terminal-related transcriptional regulator [Actinomycetota bacterium]|nr:LuxR C-terminal-related transcriptional regulator [Actinomycetota bacterium]
MTATTADRADRGTTLAGRSRELTEALAAVGLRATGNRTSGGVVVRGPAGAGRSALAAEVGRLARASGRPVVELVASPAAARVPFGATSVLLDADTTLHDPSSVLVAVRHALDRCASRDDLLIVDDAHHLDAGSVVALEHAARHGVSLLLTVRDPAPLAPDLSSFVDIGAMHVVELGPLDHRGVADLVESALLARPDDESVHRLLRAGDGIPLYVVELLTAAIEDGRAEVVDGTATVRGPFRATARLARAVERWTASLTRHARHSLEILAASSRLPLTAAEAVCGGDALAELELAGLAVLDAGADPAEVRLAHPLVGEAVAGATPALRWHLALTRAAEAIDRVHDPDDPELNLRTVLLRIEAGLAVPPERVLAAARRAHEVGDEPLAEDLLRAALESGECFELRLLLGQVVAGQRRLADAADELRAATGLAASDEALARAAAAHAHLVGSRMVRPDEAVEVLEGAVRRMESGRWRSFLSTHADYFRLAAGRPPSGGAPSETDPDAPAPLVFQRDLVDAAVAACAGRVADAATELDRLAPLSARVAVPPLIERLVEVLHTSTTMLDGDADGAGQAIDEALTRYTGRDERRGTWLALRASQQLMAGDALAAKTSAAEAELLLGSGDALGLAPTAAGLRAVALAHLARGPEAMALVDQAGPGAHDLQFQALAARARAWATDGPARDEAVLALVDLAIDLVGRGHAMAAAFAAHDAVRLGDTDRAVDLLVGLADDAPGRMLSLLARHATATAEQDPRALADVAEELAGVGLRVSGAEVAHRASVAFRRQRRPSDADRTARRAAQLLAGCTALVTALGGTDAPRTLTGREREVVDLAARRMRSREIAERLGVSVRTVDNHLGSAYRKLGVSGRDALVDLLGG